MTALTWLFVLAGLVAFDARILPPILPAIAETLGATAGEAGRGVTAYAFAYGVMQVVYGPLSDRYGRVRVIRATALLFAAGTVLSGLAHSLAGFVGARLLTGLFAAATIPTTFAYVGDTVRYEDRQRIVGRFTILFSSAQALSATLAGTVTYFVSWRLLFAGYAVVTLITVAAMRGAREAPRLVAARPTRYADIVRLARAQRLYGATCAEGFCALGGTTYFAVLAKQRYAVNDLEVGLLIAAFGVGTIGGGLLLARLVPALGERVLARGGGLAQALGFGALVPAAPWPVFATALVVIGVGYAWLHSTLQTRGTELMPEARGKAMSAFALSYFFGGAAGTAALGSAVDGGLLRSVMAACGVGLLVVGWFVGRGGSGSEG